MAVKCLPLPDTLRITWREFKAKTPEQQRAYFRAVLAYWDANDQYQRQLEDQADKQEQDIWW